MTHILIVYGTTDGHTRKIAQVLAENLRARRAASISSTRRGHCGA
jgi:flavodoxin